MFVENGTLILEEYYEQQEWEKNDDDCYDLARERGEEIIRRYPELEMEEYFCHRHKYAITHLKLKI